MRINQFWPRKQGVIKQGNSDQNIVLKEIIFTLFTKELAIFRTLL